MIATSFFDKEFVVVGGKGGVGKTSLTVALGKLSARRGRRTLICLANAPARYRALLGGVPLTPEISTIEKNLDAVNLEPRASQEEYGRSVLPSRTLHKLVFGSQVVRTFLDAVPGLAEWAMLGKATYHALASTPQQPKYDIVLFDSPATGHGLDVLGLPRAIAASVPAGRIRDEALQRVELLEDPSRTEAIPVTLPEEMPVTETREYIAGLRELHLPVERVIVNRFLSDPPSAGLKAAVEDEGKKALPEWMLPAAVALGAYASQKHAIERLERNLRIPIIVLPHLREEGLGAADIDVLADELEPQISR